MSRIMYTKEILLLLIGVTVGVLLLSPIINSRKIEVFKTSPIEKTFQATEDDVICPYVANGKFKEEYFSGLFNEVIVTYPPVLIDPIPDVKPLNEKFDPSKPPGEEKFYLLESDKGNPWKERKFDVDGDKTEERVLDANLAMNHTPHVIKIVKNGNVIFEASGANVWIDEVYDHNGFFLKVTLDWNKGTYKKTRYIFQDGKFIPVWYQISCAVQPKLRMDSTLTY